MKSLEEAFYKVNSSGSGTISQSELQQALRDVGLPKIEDEETHQMIQKVSIDVVIIVSTK